MALPYKLFKSLTIDGETTGLDPDVGKGWSASAPAASVVAGVNRFTPAITVPEAGLYLIRIYSVYTPASTGNAVAKAGISFNGTTIPDAARNYTYAANGVNISYMAMIEREANDTIYGGFMATVAGTASITIAVRKLLKVGGGNP